MSDDTEPGGPPLEGKALTPGWQGPAATMPVGYDQGGGPGLPELVHAGTYALYRTPAGGLHVTFTRTVAADLDGRQLAVDDAPAEHLPDIPAEALPMLESWLAHGFPPAVLNLLAGKMNPATLIKAMRAATNGGPDAG